MLFPPKNIYNLREFTNKVSDFLNSGRLNKITVLGRQLII